MRTKGAGLLPWGTVPICLNHSCCCWWWAAATVDSYTCLVQGYSTLRVETGHHCHQTVDSCSFLSVFLSWFSSLFLLAFQNSILSIFFVFFFPPSQSFLSFLYFIYFHVFSVFHLSFVLFPPFIYLISFSFPLFSSLFFFSISYF